MHDETLNELIERARRVEMTPKERRLQLLSFAYGNLELSTNHGTGLTFEEFCVRYGHLV